MPDPGPGLHAIFKETALVIWSGTWEEAI